MIWRVRRVLTGHDAQGKSTFIADGLAPNVKEMASMPGLALTDLWETRGAPASNAGRQDAAAHPGLASVGQTIAAGVSISLTEFLCQFVAGS